MAGNVKASVDGNILRLEVDLTCDLGLSSSGKTRLIASGTGKVIGHEGVSYGLNVYRKAAKPAAPTA
jgi:hypothetical protein